MVFNGFQKLTLLDFPGKVACILFLGGCNLRCPFCHNASLVTHINNEYAIDENEVISYLKKRQGILEGVVITGGEPLLRDNLADFLKRVKALGYSIKLDTNGFFPEKMVELIEGGLVDYVAMDIKNSFEKYPLTTGIEKLDIEPLKRSINYLLSGKIDYEFRTTIVSQFHTEEDIENICKIISGAKKYYLQNFVDSGDIISSGLCAICPEKLKKMGEIATQFVPNAEIRGI